MSFLKQLDDKGAVLQWSPLAKCSNFVALGTQDSTGSGFTDYGGELELHKLNFANRGNNTDSLLGKVRTNSRFASIGWSKMVSMEENFPYGLIAGGMIDGTINVWDPAKLVSGENSLLTCVDQHQGAVHGLQFNPHNDSSYLLASGGDDGEVYILALDRPEQPNVFIPAPNNTKHTCPITKVAWNSQVAHIVATSAQNGSCIIWDLKQKKAWCELKDPANGNISDIAWNPDQGLHLVTAGGDDKNPVIKLWDLRSSTSLPLATLQGHSQGILSVSWCPADTSLLLSCGKDNKTLLWDLFHLQTVYELPTGAVSTDNSSDIFGGYGALGNRRYNIAWSPHLPAVVSTCSFDRSVQFYSLSGVKSKLGRAPKWLRKPVGGTFGFGGKLVSFDNKVLSTTTDNRKLGTNGHTVKLSQVVENVSLLKTCTQFQAAVDSGDFNSYCSIKSNTALPSKDREVWGLMRVICFEKNAREELLSFLGFDSSRVELAVSNYVRELHDDKIDLDQGRESSLTPRAAFASSAAIINANKMEIVEPMIRKALVVGNFAAAVDCCIEAGLMAEALLLAQCGDQSLWTKTQNIYFEKQRNNLPFLSILQAVIKNDLVDFVKKSNLKMWKETLAILSTYGKSDDFPSLCELLANRLENDAADIDAAVLCYMCATNIDKTIHYWIQDLQHANHELGAVNTTALQEFIEKVVVYTANTNEELSCECGAYFAKYVELVSSQGKLEIAARYLKGTSNEEKILRDRLYNAGHKPAGSRPPPFPFTKVSVSSTTTVQLADPVIPQNNISRVRSGSSDFTVKSVHSTIPVTQPDLQIQQNQQHSSQSWQSLTNNQHLEPQLPHGWLQLTDSATGRYYYVNQATGQSQWEVPVVQQEVVSYTGMGLHSKPGVEPNPMQNPNVPQAQLSQPSPLTSVDDSSSTGSDDLLIMLDQVTSSLIVKSLGTTDKKQLQMIQGCNSLLAKAVSEGAVSPEVLMKLEQFVYAVNVKNFQSATAVQTDLTNNYWNQHKDWIKGLKVLIQLLSKY